MPGDGLHSIPHPVWDSRRLWSLADMINFYLSSFLHSWDDLSRVLSMARIYADRSNGEVADKQHESIKISVDRVIKECTTLNLTEATTACWQIEHMFQCRAFEKYEWSDLARALDRLHGDMSVALAMESFYHYPADEALALRSIPADWETVLGSFPSTRREIECGTDCYALRDYSGCVFHMMRVAEFGLRTIAKERGVKSVGRNKPIEWGTWKDVFDAIEKELKDLRGKPAGRKRETALAFYDTAISELRTLQGLYRDPTMHFRDNYDKGEAYSAMFRVRSLMASLSTKLSEDRGRKIAWGL
jgi:hypothetical protein